MKNDILETSDFGTSKRQNVKASPKPVKERPNLKRDTNRFIGWLDRNVLPMIALVVISGLAVKGLALFLPEMNDTTRTVASVLAVAILVVKLQAGKL